jgi:glycosyltransferase involved in cell wall biosynthesis
MTKPEVHTGYNRPLASVVIPAYNTDRFLPAMLASVLTQSHRHLEVIIVDDGSTDRTAAHLDHRVRIIGQENTGVAAARNRRLGEARGEYVAPIDADDVWHPENLASQVAALEAAGPAAAVSYAWFASINEHGRFLGLGLQT